MIQLKETLDRHGLEREQRQKIGFFVHEHSRSLAQPLYLITPTGYVIYCDANLRTVQHRAEAEVEYLSGPPFNGTNRMYTKWLYGRTNTGEALCREKMRFMLQLFQGEIIPILVPSSLDESTDAKKGFDVLLCKSEGMLKNTPVYSPYCGIDCTYQGPGVVKRKRTQRAPIDPYAGIPVIVLPLYGAKKPWKKGEPPITQVDRKGARIRMNDQIRHCILNGGGGTIIPFYGLTTPDETSTWTHMYVDQLMIALQEAKQTLTSPEPTHPILRDYPHTLLVVERLEMFLGMVEEIKRAV